MTKPILCLDFDGVIHSYTSGWKGADVIPDPPVPGAMRFIWDAADHFTIAIFSSRSHQSGGKSAMQAWLAKHFRTHWAADRTHCDDVLAEIQWPNEKPSAFVTLDDRAIQFEGMWPEPKALLDFKPWNKRTFGAMGRHSMPPISDDDEGDIKIGIAYDPVDGLVNIRFGKPVAWLAFPKEHAVVLARSLLSKAGATKVEISFGAALDQKGDNS